MPSGFENYGSFEYTNPATALSAAQSHRTWLMQQMTPKVGSNQKFFDPSYYATLIDRVDRDIIRLANKALRCGVPCFVPTVRVDPLGTFHGNP